MKNLETVLAILRNEVNGDIASALQKMADDYSMTWMYESTDELFPSSKPDFAAEMENMYPIKNRKYEVKNTAEGENVVMVELIESYPNPETGELHQTPLVLVLEFKNGKIQTGRHYCDPRLSRKELSREELDRAFRGTQTKEIIE